MDRVCRATSICVLLASAAGCPNIFGSAAREGGNNDNGQEQVVRSGTEEFGLSKRELADAIEQVESRIAACMRQEGFEYVAADYSTVRQGMLADKSMPGLSDREFHEQYGYGIATLYTGLPPQLNDGYCPGRKGLALANIEIYKNLSPADQASYNRALFGENNNATFAVGLETEDFSRCGGCTRKAIEQVFEPKQLQASYYNPLDALINNDPRMKAALREFAQRLREQGFEYDHPDEPEIDIRQRLDAITDSGAILLQSLPAEKKEALGDLQDFERRVAIIVFELQQEIFEPVEAQIEEELFARPIE